MTVKQESKTQVRPLLPSPKPESRKISQDFSSQQKQIPTKQETTFMKAPSSFDAAKAVFEQQQPLQLPPRPVIGRPVSAHYSTSSMVTKETVPQRFYSERTTVPQRFYSERTTVPQRFYSERTTVPQRYYSERTTVPQRFYSERTTVPQTFYSDTVPQRFYSDRTTVSSEVCMLFRFSCHQTYNVT